MPDYKLQRLGGTGMQTVHCQAFISERGRGSKKCWIGQASVAASSLALLWPSRGGNEVSGRTAASAAAIEGGGCVGPGACMHYYI